MFILSISKDDMSKIFQKFKSRLDHSSKNAWTILGQLNSCIIQFLSFFPKKKKGGWKLKTHILSESPQK